MLIPYSCFLVPSLRALYHQIQDDILFSRSSLNQSRSGWYHGVLNQLLTSFTLCHLSASTTAEIVRFKGFKIYFICFRPFLLLFPPWDSTKISVGSTRRIKTSAVFHHLQDQRRWSHNRFEGDPLLTYSSIKKPSFGSSVPAALEVSLA